MPPPPPFKQKIGVEPENTFTDVFDNTCDIGDFKAHIFYQQTTQELPKKHHEAGSPEQLPTNALSQIDYGHTRHCKRLQRGLLMPTNNAKGILENLGMGMRMRMAK